MTKQRWEHVRTLKEVPMDVWFEYYKEMGGMLPDQETFEEVFVRLIASGKVIINSKGTPVEMTFPGALDRLYKYYNGKFDN